MPIVHSTSVESSAPMLYATLVTDQPGNSNPSENFDSIDNNSQFAYFNKITATIDGQWELRYRALMYEMFHDPASLTMVSGACRSSI